MRKILDFKALIVDLDKIMGCKGYNLYIYDEINNTSYKISELDSPVYFHLSKFQFTRRITRAEITGCFGLGPNQLIVGKKGIFNYTEKSKSKKIFSTPRGSKPLNICVLPNNHAYFGEYFQNIEKKAVNIYGTHNNGVSWNIVFTFAAGNINHIHGLFYDKFTNRIWVSTGDRENECIIGYTDDEFESFNEVFRGGQEYRSCLLFFYPKFIVFATDSQYIQNEIRCFDRKTLEIRTLAKIQGSAIKGGQTGEVSFLSTTVEPSEVNKDKDSHVWVTKDGSHWHDVYSAPKDRWPSIFQFGTFEFPQYKSPIKDKLYCSGRALKGCDGKTICIDISDI